MPREMSDTMHEVILTEPSDPSEIIRSGYGKITMLEWCNLEAERLVRSGRNCELAFNDSGMVAVREWIAPGKWDNFVVNSEDESEG